MTSVLPKNDVKMTEIFCDHECRQYSYNFLHPCLWFFTCAFWDILLPHFMPFYNKLFSVSYLHLYLLNVKRMLWLMWDVVKKREFFILASIVTSSIYHTHLFLSCMSRDLKKRWKPEKNEITYIEKYHQNITYAS